MVKSITKHEENGCMDPMVMLKDPIFFHSNQLAISDGNKAEIIYFANFRNLLL